MLQYNLQFFAPEGPGGEKTEPATEKKLSDARKKGQVAKSREIANGVGIFAIFILIRFWAGTMGTFFIGIFQNVYSRFGDYTYLPDSRIPSGDYGVIVRYGMLQILLCIAPFLITFLIVALVSDIAQVGWKPTAETLKPKFDRLNPASGVKKLFSSQSLAELVKAIMKIVFILYMAYSYLRGRMDEIYLLYDMSVVQGVQLLSDILFQVGIRIAAAYLLIAIGDFVYQKVRFNNDMKMTKQEVKEEYKEQEGDPEIKGKQKQRMQEASRRRMMQDLPKADVVITNPTHYAVAIRYDRETDQAPVVLAKGADYLAQRIKDVARENNVEIVENKPLARTLYTNVEIGQEIPPELYQAVAEVLALVYKLQNRL
ncbi:MAG: flagellar biosynthesis protein FlhB [Lachnospiraceae bacterium]|nr:flagellar biosynthesis protein FlhB [Lachnospiraceae bacterium]